jgi:hypothetical protein
MCSKLTTRDHFTVVSFAHVTRSSALYIRCCGIHSTVVRICVSYAIRCNLTSLHTHQRSSWWVWNEDHEVWMEAIYVWIQWHDLWNDGCWCTHGVAPSRSSRDERAWSRCQYHARDPLLYVRTCSRRQFLRPRRQRQSHPRSVSSLTSTSIPTSSVPMVKKVIVQLALPRTWYPFDIISRGEFSISCCATQPNKKIQTTKQTSTKPLKQTQDNTSK